MYYLALVLSLAVTWQALGQAPGDFDPSCREGTNAENKNFPPDTEVLLDTTDYTFLFEGINFVWVERDFDSDDTNNWRQNIGGLCRWSMNTCGFSSNVQPQNNWLFSQHISYLDANEIFFNVTFDFTNCRDNAECSNDYVTLYYYDTNGPVNEELRTDREMYTTLRRLQQRPDGQGGDTVHFPFTRPQSDTNGFYLGVQDDGTCGTVGRILVYYRVARGRTEDLLTCPDVALPIQGSNLNSQGTCSCGANASLASATLNRICNEDGICNENQVCACVPGYYLASSDCTACPGGMYKAGVSNSSCQPCPNNSLSIGEGNAVCQCIPPNIRNPDRPQDPCAMPPSSPRLILAGGGAPRVSGNSISVCWLPALDSGGLNDLHYNIYLYDTTSDNPEFLKVNNEGIVQDTGNSETNVCYDVAIEDTSVNYGVLVVSANGATGDPQNFTNVNEIQGRFVVFFVSSHSPSSNVAVAVVVTLFLTLIVTAVITTLVVFLIMKFFVHKSNHSNSSGGRDKYSSDYSTKHDVIGMEKTRRPAPKKPPPPRPPTRPVYT